MEELEKVPRSLLSSKNQYNIEVPSVGHVSDIKLIRTDHAL